MRDKKLIIMFLVLIFGVFIAIPCKFVLVRLGVLEINRDNFSEYVGVKETSVIDKFNNLVGKVEKKLENTYTNYFPFYNAINGVYQNINFYSNSLVYEDVPIKVNSDGEYVFYNKKDGFYYLENKYESVELDKRLDKQVAFFNELGKSVDLYIYVPTRYEYTSLKENNLSVYLDKFKEKLNNNITLSIMDIQSVEEYKTYFYKTDHHWTINGALVAYQSIMDMMGKEMVDYGNVVEHKEKKYYGSLAKSALMDNVYDYISDIDVKLDYKVLVNGSEADNLFKPRSIRLDRSYKYYDYYVSYFNGQYGNVVYDYENEEENLLILGDSYTWQIDHLIGASFNKTHVINLRYDEYKNKEFNLTKYVKDNDIDKVLILYDGGSTLFDQYDYDFEGRVK